MRISTIKSPPHKTLEDSERAQVRNCVDKANGSIARCWPLRTFIYRNPLKGLEHLPFHQAIDHGRDLFGGRGYLSNESYRNLYHSGKITEASILEVLTKSPMTQKAGNILQIGEKHIDANEIFRLHLVYGIDPINESLLHWKIKNEKILSRYRQDVPFAVRKQSETVIIPLLWQGILKTLGIQHNLEPKDEFTNDLSAPTPSEGEERLSSFLRDLAKVGKRLTIGEWIQEINDIPVKRIIDEQMTKWCSAFLDEGMASWEMPSREKGFYRAWLDVASLDRSGEIGRIQNLLFKIQNLSQHPEDTIAGCLKQMGVKNEIWPDYLERHLSQMPGWASFIKWRADETENIWQKHFPIDPTQYLAVRLFYETELVDSVCQSTWNMRGTLSGIQTYFQKSPEAYPLKNQINETIQNQQDHQPLNNAWRFFNLAQFLGLDHKDIQTLSQKEVKRLLDALDQFPSEEHGYVWLQALEFSYKKNLLEELSSVNQNKLPRPKNSPQVQAVFCIDARSEVLRRHLENIGPYETFGFAGFFGVPVCYSPYGSDTELLLCPALIKPERKIFEIPKTPHEKEIKKNATGSKWHHSNHSLFHDLKSNNFSAYLLIDLLGGLFGITFLAKTFFPASYQRFRKKIHQHLVPEVPTKLLLNRPIESDSPEGIAVGFSLEEQVTLLENGLRMMGLTHHFAAVIFMCAHGSTAENNPYAAAYDCGACGGNHGGPNARALVSIANKPEVRKTLKTRGIEIPSSTLFIAGEHNTTTDQVILFDMETIPASHRAHVCQLQKDLDQAGMFVAFERVKKLPGAPQKKSFKNTSSHVQARSGDWSQVRPEWGLSSNTAFIIGRRKLSQGINLEGRVFMHSYDPKQDTTGKALAGIMTAPLLVIQWISMEYYFSSTDPFVYGSASKVYHNVVSGIGVMVGRESDLRPGLPLQSVINGKTHFHEPMRPLAIIDAPAERIQQTIDRHEILQTLFNNSWINLVVWNADDGSFGKYLGKDRWESIALSPKVGRG